MYEYHNPRLTRSSPGTFPDSTAEFDPRSAYSVERSLCNTRCTLLSPVDAKRLIRAWNLGSGTQSNASSMLLLSCGSLNRGTHPSGLLKAFMMRKLLATNVLLRLLDRQCALWRTWVAGTSDLIETSISIETPTSRKWSTSRKTSILKRDIYWKSGTQLS